jgi:transposase-like protein
MNEVEYRMDAEERRRIRKYNGVQRSRKEQMNEVEWRTNAEERG